MAMAWHDYSVDYAEPQNRKRPLKAIRLKCLDCCCQNAAEVRRCEITTCSLWPYRMGRNPARAGIGGQPQFTKQAGSPDTGSRGTPSAAKSLTESRAEPRTATLRASPAIETRQAKMPLKPSDPQTRSQLARDCSRPRKKSQETA